MYQIETDGFDRSESNCMKWKQDSPTDEHINGCNNTPNYQLAIIRKTVASNEGTHNTAAGSAADGAAGTSGESAALFSKLRSFSIGSGPNSPQRVVSNLRGYLTHRLSNITPSDTGWRDSLLSIPKKWLSTAESVDEFGFPCTLPKVPVPPLEETMANYILAIEAFTTPAKLECTKLLIKKFMGPDGIGQKCHQYLMDKREAEDNWAYNYWLNDMYMDVRLPLPINSNPGMPMPPVRFTTVHDVARFAALLLSGIMKHKELLDSGNLPIDRAGSREKNQPLCMAQYYRPLGSCRRPGLERDTQYLAERGEKSDEHVIVVCRNQMYCVNLKTSSRGRISETEIASNILYVLSDAPCLPTKPPMVGLLTAEERTRWATNRNLLLENEVNQNSILLIEKALCILCIDEPLPNTFNAYTFTGATPTGYLVGDRDDTNMLHEMIHGGGSNYNSANRWFDKVLQIIICTDGTWGINYEHSFSEGDAIVNVIEKIYKNLEEKQSACNSVPSDPTPERIPWVITPQMDERIKQAAVAVDKAIGDFDLYVYRYKGYGKNFIKQCKCSPDAFLQLMLQLSYFKLYGHFVATYESASTRRFLLGRVDCIRASHKEALEWATAMCQGEGANVPLESEGEDDDARKVKFSIYNKDKLKELFRIACNRQTEIMVQNILGHGIDIPLLGLREASKEFNNGQVHELFNHETFQTANIFLLSTSQVATKSDAFMGYGAVTPRGYGCSYNPHADDITFCISAFYSCEDTSTTRFAKSLKESLDMMKDLMKDETDQTK
ncbi:PREDICTED: choline O-acetyltransferase [Bactrocera latifrons]|uniref:choline O-acetyltransferase n=1 Tax=Bactrocera latifrons TaxID=174628 RepID=UPI0008DE835B|nr:PREDICTED: choline O-acetyltransferase [Bactrocera latifrons]